MASRILMPNTSFNPSSHVSYMSWIPNSHSFGQVCLPRKTNEFVFSNFSISSRSQAFLSSVITPTLSSSKLSRTTNTISGSTDVSMSSLCHVWREIQGCDDWEGFVEPLHPLLRQEIIRYGEFVTACYKAFDHDPNSKRYLTCKYGKKSLLKQVGMEDSGYQVTKYIYATPDISIIPIQNASSCGRWIGYVAVSSDNEVKRLGRRDIVVTFRGTVTNAEWIANLMSSLTPARLDPNNPRPEVKVESGFLSLYTSNESGNKFGLESCREQLLSEVSRLLNEYRNEEVSITLAGHSMGGSLAVLLGYDIAEIGLNKRINPNKEVPVTVFSFGGPRVGNVGFKQRCEELGVKVLRIVNVNDPITKIPGVLLNENNIRVEFPWSRSCYSHVGVELALEFFNMQNPSCVHDLESYLNLLKCPALQQAEDDRVEDEDEEDCDDDDREKLLDLLSRAREFLPTNFDISPLKNAATNMVNLAQSQSCEILGDDNVLEWMNSLALCIFL